MGVLEFMSKSPVLTFLLVFVLTNFIFNLVAMLLRWIDDKQEVRDPLLSIKVTRPDKKDRFTPADSDGGNCD